MSILRYGLLIDGPHFCLFVCFVYIVNDFMFCIISRSSAALGLSAGSLFKHISTRSRSSLGYFCSIPAGQLHCPLRFLSEGKNEN